MSGRFGGLARRATAIEGLRAEGPPVLYVDGGDLLFSVTDLEGYPVVELWKERATLVSRALVQTGVAGVNVGRHDLAAGLSFVESLGKGAAPVPWVSANLRRKGGGHPFPPWRVVALGDQRMAVFGLLPPDPARDAALGIEVADPVATAAAVVKELPPVDAVLCLSNLGLVKEVELAKRVPGITVVVGGGSGELLLDPERVGNTRIVHAADKGKFLGVLDSFRLPNDSGPSSQGFSPRLVTLDATVSEDPKVASLVRKYKESEALQNKHLAPPPPPPRPTFASGARLCAGSAACRECHADAYRSWLATRHARAGLALKGKEQDATCVKCHSSLLTRASGPVTEPVVSCEVCHGPGATHRGKGEVLRRPSEQVCRRCHAGFHKEAGFDLRTAYERVRCDRK